MFGIGDRAKLTGKGAEAKRGNVKVKISKSPKEEYVKTGHVFLDKIVNGLSEHSPFSFVIESEGPGDKILEHSGFAIGLGLKRLMEVSGKRFASHIHSDGKRMCTFSFDLSGDIRGSTIQLIGKPKEFDTRDLFAFFDSLSQGMESEISGVINLGKRKKEVEFVSAAFAGSLRQVFG
jgi:imidazoleglycerol phosphate dehydratase HisB